MFKKLFKNNFEAEENREKEIFNKGVKHGIEIGVEKGMNLSFIKSKEVSEEKYNNLMNFLISNEIQMCYTQTIDNNMRNCGLVVRERKYNKP